MQVVLSSFFLPTLSLSCMRGHIDIKPRSYMATLWEERTIVTCVSYRKRTIVTCVSDFLIQTTVDSILF